MNKQTIKIILNKALLSNRKIVIVSDFDDTLVSKYKYNSLSGCHYPKYDLQLVKLIQEFSTQLKIPFIIATARGTDDLALNAIASLSDHPVLLENGCVILKRNQIENLVQEDSQLRLSELKKIIQKKLFSLQLYFWRQSVELSIRLTRLTSIEFRLQTSDGQGISEEKMDLYDHIRAVLELDMIPFKDQLKFIQGMSSLSIAPTNISKWDGVKHLLNREFGYKNPFIISFGDSDNDSELLSSSQIGFSVGTTKIGSSIHVPGNEVSVKTILSALKELLYENNYISH